MELLLEHIVLCQLFQVVALSALQMTQFSYQVNIRLISQLITSNSGVLQKLLKYFNGTAIPTFAIPTLVVVCVSLE